MRGEDTVHMMPTLDDAPNAHDAEGVTRLHKPNAVRATPGDHEHAAPVESLDLVRDLRR